MSGAWVTFDDEPAFRAPRQATDAPRGDPTPPAASVSPHPPDTGLAPRGLVTALPLPEGHAPSGQPSPDSGLARGRETGPERRGPGPTPGSPSPAYRRPERLRASSEPPGPAFVPRSLFRPGGKSGWALLLRIPEKKSAMSSRQWGPIFLRVAGGGVLQLFYARGLERPFRELRLGPRCRLSEPTVERGGPSGPVHAVKLERVTYSERRRGRAARAVHAAQLLKVASPDHEDFLDFLGAVEEELVKLPPAPAAPRPARPDEEREMFLELDDRVWAAVRRDGGVAEAAVVTRVSCLCFLNAGDECFLALAGPRPVAGPGGLHVHPCARAADAAVPPAVRFSPPDACRLELMRFGTAPAGAALPLTLRARVAVRGARVELRASVRAGPSPACSHVAVHFPVPARWDQALGRPGSLRARVNRGACLGARRDPDSEPVVRATVGTARYEGAYGAVVWRIENLPDEDSAPDHRHGLLCRLELGSDQDLPEDWSPFASVRFVTPDVCASGTEVRALGTDGDLQPQKHVVRNTRYHLQPILYRSVIEDVIEGMRELFAEEGVDEQVLNDLKQLWETKVVQSKAMEGFFRNTLHTPLTLQLPPNLHQTLSSLVIPAGRSISSFTGELGPSSSSIHSTLPAGIGYPIHVPAGVTLQTASGQLYKVNIPVVVTQAPEGGGLLQHPIQTMFQRLGQPQVAVGAELQLPDARFWPPPWGLGEGKASEGATGDAPAPPPSDVGGAGTPAAEPGFPGMAVPWAVAGPQASGPHREADDGGWLPTPRQSGDEFPRGERLRPPGMVPGGPRGSEEVSPSEPGIIQVDGAGDAWSGGAVGSVEEADENEFLGIMSAEDLKALDEEGDTASNGDSTSGSSSSSDGGEQEDPQLDVVEEDPLNSGDDVSEQDVPDLFETDNVIVCQYDKIHRSKNRWKFYLKDGVMCFGGKDYVFARATGDAEW
ncbi:uncharacterized protein LOC119932422 [Tachyglossus aculeatus]|uniref:uncharacterized protein LOC119932422 n=1 Tax=Tachyglossus aculeatus TaxID=9261 RepID=UPI0018F48526|nr:uncharacterized protein LOC119932422 [Tachyglossus aculeatus]